MVDIWVRQQGRLREIPRKGLTAVSYKQRKSQEFAGMCVLVLGEFLGSSGQHRTAPTSTPYTTHIHLLPIRSLTWEEAFENFGFSLFLGRLTEETQQDKP